jgi:peptidoglycan hydrolase-like protein with peptidoglycan-binding domain
MLEAASSAPTTGGTHRHARPTTSPWRIQRIILAVALALGVTMVGLVAPTTRAEAAIPIPPSATHYPALQYGRTGTAVKYLQQRLHVQPTSGWFGPITRRAVIAFQAAHGIARTGIVLVPMWHALGVKYVRPTPAPAPGSNAFYQRVLTEAAKHKGAPYVFGAEGPYAFDCSGFTQYVYKKAGKKIPRTASQQRRYLHPISRSQLRAGDLVFVRSGSGASHAAIYAGGNKWWEASRPGKPLSLDWAWTTNVSYGRA